MTFRHLKDIIYTYFSRHTYIQEADKLLDFKLASVLMAILTSNILIAILTLIFLKESILYRFGLHILGAFCILIFVRMAIPFEFVKIAITLKLPAIFSKILVYIQHPRILLFGHNYSIWEFLVLIWIIVFFILLLDYINSIKKMYKYIQEYGSVVTNDYVTLMNKLCPKKKFQEKIIVIRLPLIPSPSVFKYGLKYYILIPRDLELNEEENELIFRHELSHITHHDLILKFFLQILYLFYWWNLFCYPLRKQSNLLFELRVDSSVIEKGHDKIQKYLLCLLKVEQYSVDNQESNLPLSTTISFLHSHSSNLHKRFCYIMENSKPKNKYLAKLILIPACVLYLISFIFIFEAYYKLPESFIKSEIV